MSHVMTSLARDVPQESHPGPVAVAAGARSAGLLREACRRALASGGPDPRLEVVRYLAAETERELDALARCAVPAPDLLAEAALR